MSHLGSLRGIGQLSCAAGDMGPVEYDLDGYITGAGEIIASGEILVATEHLQLAYGRPDVTLTTEAGRVLTVRFSTKRANSPNDAAHADVGGDLPPAKEWKR
jgi:hypothetical protein